MNFDMQVTQNCASFYNPTTRLFVVVDSFDNREFDVRVGSLSKTELVGTVCASNSVELNEKLAEMTASYL
ncbi:TPA: hypothetical protein ACV1O4_002945 [Yersinia enterocolitica]|uniref:Uncharacterized protein n=1 Tax=Yersinia ruckeri TaxID=29486 RepID=A0A380QTU5_YERRU|nr:MULTISPECIES: hypothetical protein [Yersinia]EKN3941219.1 hypothetical protein [Yersinia enterocolitica]KGA51112.1 hypothetical protein DJ39_2336 [Yersinia ruckeri ATCC 29473]MCK8594616.1 hypothetical protein [Yersinia ruckeri]MCK8597491.1 hypothetical protein [Yersinia ruckeri]MCW6610064.1 hypothetical protein [Yersinia ruckeri]